MSIIESSGAEVVTVDVHTAKALTLAGHAYLDVRTSEEFEEGHPAVDRIINIPYMFDTPEGRVKNPEFLNQVWSSCNKEDHLVVGCQSGVRSMQATGDLVGDGYKNVRNMGGGYLEWVKNQLPVQAAVAKD
ncbi:thiosulfate sulfurtransferase 18-like isoform X1 [Prosopis cineraria]|uniref:thiosulfate sulfurtransferase 18-like isoform X1 n=1 Tax=Prosopis cineraria TaxID=364024 RepID=UPI00240F0ADA|nr:thiosulfate sulfurtransferase 18-like isoform X1 [Prosopis cineraria]